jgi:hypothetical protein
MFWRIVSTIYDKKPMCRGNFHSILQHDEKTHIVTRENSPSFDFARALL